MAAYDTLAPQLGDEILDRLGKLLIIMGGVTPTPGSGGGSEVAGTFTLIAATAGQTKTIPIGAKGASVFVLTGTATMGGTDLPVGLPLDLGYAPAAPIDVVFGSPGTGRITYGT